MWHLQATATLLLERHHTHIHISIAMGGDIIIQIPTGLISAIQCSNTLSASVSISYFIVHLLYKDNVYTRYI